MFCSEECRKVLADQIEEFREFYNPKNSLCTVVAKLLSRAGGLEELHAIFSDETSTTIFDYDFNNPNDPETKRNFLRCFKSLKQKQHGPSLFSNVIEQESADGYLHEMELPPRATEILKNFLEKLKNVYMCNAILLSPKDVNEGNIIGLFAGLINHSCDNNVQPVEVNGKFSTVVKKPIKAGEQLFVRYR
jgi:hypothetical protein